MFPTHGDTSLLMVTAHTNFAEAVYLGIRKSNPDDVVFWVFLFALNQHRTAEEVGSTP